MSEKIYIGLNIDPSVVKRLKIAAAKQGEMRYSMIAESIMAQAFDHLKS